MNSEVYSPEIMPIIRGSAKVKMLSSPNRTDTTQTVSSAMQVVKVVFTERRRLWLMLAFTRLSKPSFLPYRPSFSRMRSYMTTVSLME